MRHLITDDAFHGGEPVPAAWPRDGILIHRFEPAGQSLPPARVRVAGATPPPPTPVAPAGTRESDR